MLSHYSPKIMVGFNIKFDILHAIYRDEENLNAWMDWIVAGGQLWDCQLAEYLLEGMVPEAQILSLDEVAPRYGGVVKIDEVKAMWEAGIDTPDIPDDLMMKYLPGDLTNTEKVFVGQYTRAKAVGQTKSIMLNMGSLVYTIEAERNGMCIDQELGHVLAKELSDEIVELAARLNQYIPADFPTEFKWTSRFHQSALIFGGPVKYEVDEPIFDEAMQPVYYQLKEVQYVKKDGTTTPDMMDPDIAYYASGKNSGQAKTKQVTVPDIARGQKTRKADRVYQLPGFTKPDPSWESSTEGVYSVAGEVIEALGNRDIPFLKDLARRARLTKDLGTYFIVTDPKTGEQSGMLTLVQLDGCIHGQFNHTLTVTGRFSSSKPNLQNLSGKDKSKVKSVFISRWREHGVICQSDFTSLEVYIQAVLTGDKQLIADLLAGLDMHCVKAAAKAHVDYEFVMQKVKVDKDPEWIFKRKKAKEYSFQRAYGAGAAAIALSTGMDIEEVKELIAVDQARYPQIDPWYEGITKVIEGSKRGIRKVIPHPNFPAKQCELRTGYWRAPDNKLYAWLEQPSPKFVVEREGRFTGFTPTEIKNYPVQGTGGEWAKAAMWLAVRAFYARKNFGGKALLISQVHDACYGDFHNDVRDEAAALLHACMESASEFMQYYFGWHQPVHVPSETTWGASMIEEQDIPGVKDNAKKYREQLRETYMKVAA
ncbi:DNA polymerase [Pseudomonas phage vB_PpuP-Villemi]